jgi:hypothetical protein
MKKYRLFLYRPLAANYLVDSNNYNNEFLGELRADNVAVDIKLQDFSSLNFTLPDNILGEFNTRLDEVLDNYIVELWYGNLDGAVDIDYFRYRFIIVKSPLIYQNGIRVYSYEAQSLEFLLEQKILNSWPGVQVKDFYRSIKYNKLSGSSARFTESPATGVTLSPYTLSTSTYVQPNNVARTRYITVPTTTGTVAGKEPTVFDIFIYQKRFSNEDGLVKESSLIEFDGTVNDEDFKPGFYVPVLNENNKVTAVQISLPNDLSYFTEPNKDFEILLYDNPTYRHFAVGINTDQEVAASDMYLDLAQDEPVTFTIDLAAKIGEAFLVNSFKDPNFNKLIKGQKIEGNNIPSNSVITRVVINSQDSSLSFIQISNNISGSGSDIIVIRNINISSINIAEYGDYAFSAQMVYSKNGLKLRHVLNGTTDELEDPEDPEDPEEPGEQEITPDGILFDTGFTIGEIHETIESKYRSNIDFNNITKYQAIKDIAESFDCIAVFNSIDKTVSFYPDKNEDVFDNNGLIITDKNYLTNISNDINALKIITKAYAAGKNNLGIQLISPNGSNAWEDYSYFLDSYYVEFDIDNILDISLNSITGIEFDNFPEGNLSRWMPQDQAMAIAKWQYARDSFHELMLGNVTATGDISYLMRYYNLYNIRSRGIELLVKLESKYYERKATEYNLKYLYDFYVKDNENKTGAASRKKNLVYNFNNNTTFPVTTELPSGEFVFNSDNFTTVTKITIANFDNKSPGENARTFLASINVNNNPLLILSLNATDTNFVYYSVKGVDSVNTNSTQVVLDVEYSSQPGPDPLPTIYTNITNITFRFRTWEEIYLTKYNQAKRASEFAIKSLNRLSYILYNYRFDGTKIVPSDSDYTELSAVQADSLATKMGEVQNYLRKINWGIDEEKIKFFEREAVMNDSKLDNELDLINATREFLVENCRPIITLSINIADFLASEQAILDWNRAKIGDIINIYYPEFNIDTTAQIRELNIDFQANALSFTISTYRYYGRQPLYFLSKKIRNLYDNEQNKTLYEYDQNKDNSNTTRNYKNTLGRSDGNGGDGIDVNTVDLNFGVESEEGNESDSSSQVVYSTTVSGEGGVVSNVPEADPILETVTFTNTKNIRITDGALLAVSENEDFISEIEISGDNGIVIKKITGEDDDLVVTKQMYIDTDGNAVFAGAVSIGTGDSIFKADSLGIYLGSENFIEAPFSVSADGSLKATDGLIGGWTIQPTRLSSAEINLVANIENSYISIGQTVEGYSEDGIFIGSINRDEETKIPAFSLEITDNIDTQNFEGTYTQGDTLIDNWTSSSGVYVDYETAPDTSLVIDDYNIRTDGGLFWAFNSRTTGGNYFLMKGLSGSTSINQTLEFDLTAVGINNAYSVSFLYNVARLGGIGSNSLQLRVGTNLNSSIRTFQSTSGNWRSQSVTIPAGSSKIIFTFIKTTSGGILGLIGLDSIVINKVSGLSYNTDTGVDITGGRIARFNILGNAISLGTNTFNSTSTGIYLDASGNFSLKDAFTYNGTSLKLKNPIINGTDIIFQGAVDDSITTTLRVDEPTSTSKVITLPNLTGTVALNDAAQTFSAIKTFSARPVFTSGGVFGSAVGGSNSIEITSTGNIIFEGSSVDVNETVLTVVNPTADQTYQLPNKTAGTYTIATITDLEDNFVNTILTQDSSTLTSTSYADITGMSLTLKQNTYYRIKFFGTYNRPGGSSVVVRISMPFLTDATNAYVRGSGRYAASSTATSLTLTPLFSTAATTSSDNNSFSLGAANAVGDSVVEFEATIYTGNANGIKLQYISGVGGGGIIFRRGTLITAERIT